MVVFLAEDTIPRLLCFDIVAGELDVNNLVRIQIKWAGQKEKKQYDININ